MSEFITKEELAAVLLKVKQEAIEEALRILPSVAQSLVTQAAGIYELRSKFYAENPSYAGNKELVASVMEQVEHKHPGATYDKLLELAKPEIESKLALHKTLASTDKRKPKLEELDHLAGML